MATFTSTDIQKLYVEYFNRPADPIGLSYWVSTANLAGNLDVIYSAFGASPEYTSTFAGLDSQHIVASLYQNLFGHQPDLSGLTYWSILLSNGSLTVGKMAAAIAAGAQSTDLVAFNNKVTAATAFTTALDTSVEVLGYSGSAAGALAKAFITSVTDAASLAAALATVDATVATTTAAGNVVAGQPFTLTASVDTLVGTSGNDTFNATPSLIAAGTTVATLTALDSIDGGAGTDTLNITDVTTAFVIPTSATVKNIETANIVAAGTASGSVAGWTGLTSLTASAYGGTGGGALTAAATTAVTLTDAAAAAATISVQGGSNVAVTANGVTAAGTINVGTTTAVVGTVNVTTNMLATQTGTATADAINVKGGTTVNVTANLNEKAGLGNTVTGGAIGVTGTAATTSVTVAQTAAATAVDAVVAIAFVKGVTAATAAAGVSGVTAVTAAGATAVAALAGVVNGAVTISDSTTAAVGSIKTVSLSNYGASSAVTSNALTDLSLTGTAGTLALGRVAALSSDTLNLTLNGLSGTNTITNTNNETKTLNVTTATKDSTLVAFVDTALTTLNVAGTNVLTLTTPNTSLTKIAVSGAAGFASDVSGLGATLASFTTTSSGKITATLDAATQTFVGSTGQDVITINKDAIKVITGGSGTTDILVLNAAAATFNATSAKLTATNVTGFEVLGANTATSGTFDMSSLPTGLKSIELLGAVVSGTTFSKAAVGTGLAIDVAQTGAVTYQSAAANGAADTLALTIGTATTKDGFTVADLTVKDANNVGFGTLSVVSNASTFNNAHTITTLTDNGLSTLNVSGTGGLTITTLNQVSNQATGLTINNTSTNATGVTITTLTDSALGSLTFSGTGPSTVTSLAGLTGNVLTLANTGTGAATVTAIAAAGTNATEVNGVILNDTLLLGESMTVAGRTVTNTSSVTAITAAAVGTAMSGGAVATGLTVSGTLAGWTIAASTSATLALTSTTANTNVAAATYSAVGLTAATAGVAGVITQGAVGTTESTAWTMSALAFGQSYTIDSLVVTAQKALTGTEVAAAFAGGSTVAGSYSVSGTFGNTATWTTPVFSSSGATLTLTNGATGTATDFNTAPLANSLDLVTAPTLGVTETTQGSAASANMLQTINLTGNVAVGANSTTPEAAIGGVVGITVNGATDNAHVNIQLNAAGATYTNSTTLGNGNNFVTDLTSAGTVNVTVGTGVNLIDVKAGGNNATFAANVTLGTHTNTTAAYNKILVSDTGSQATGISATITGTSAGDVISFVQGTATDVTFVAISATLQNTITADTTLTAAINHAFGTGGATGAAYTAAAFNWQGNTYVVANDGNDTTFLAGTDTVIKLVGTHTVADFGTVNGSVTVTA